jgi:lauroyl/myristoyl acyltransferase
MALKKLGAVVGHLPVSGLSIIGRGLGNIAYWLDLRHRRIVRQNITFVYPDWRPRQRRRLAKRVFQHFGIVFLEILQTPFLPRTKLVERVRIEGQEIWPGPWPTRGAACFTPPTWEIGNSVFWAYRRG